jgi:hypothetical protein
MACYGKIVNGWKLPSRIGTGLEKEMDTNISMIMLSVSK